jgi:hypothetical protein
LKDAQFVIEKTKEIEKKEVGMRPEIERWMMRNEELEQRLFDQKMRAANMSTLLIDSQKALEFHTKSRNEESRVLKAVLQEIENFVNHTQADLQIQSNPLQRSFPDALTIIQDTLHVSLKQIKDLLISSFH